MRRSKLLFILFQVTLKQELRDNFKAHHILEGLIELKQEEFPALK
jgi:hypothetical protein